MNDEITINQNTTTNQTKSKNNNNSFIAIDYHHHHVYINCEKYCNKTENFDRQKFSFNWKTWEKMEES